ncbi:hypothetical protein ACFL27_27855 [candidate division CSSED10-310 bacterium]|uniref:Tetratricopeptide repeat protein n=1 Tax=candidate division CSSED10-310 bacterium TaxID=2855610 RepID=A0ABV6Z6F4_UNCC1
MDSDYHLVDYLSYMADLCYVLRQYDEALSWAEEAKHLAEKTNRTQAQFFIQLLAEKLNLRKTRHEQQKIETLQELNKMIMETTSESVRALLNLELYHLSQSYEHGQEALQLYQSVVKKDPTYLNKQKLQLLKVSLSPLI